MPQYHWPSLDLGQTIQPSAAPARNEGPSCVAPSAPSSRVAPLVGSSSNNEVLSSLNHMSNLFQEFFTHQSLAPTAPPANPVLGRSTPQQTGSQDPSGEEASDDNVEVDYSPADPGESESDGLDSDEE